MAELGQCRDVSKRILLATVQLWISGPHVANRTNVFRKDTCDEEALSLWASDKQMALHSNPSLSEI